MVELESRDGRRSASASPSGSATDIVAPGCVIVAVGSIAGTGSWNDRQSARSPLVVKETPRSLNDRCGGPAVLIHRKPPVTSAEAMLPRGVTSRHGP